VRIAEKWDFEQDEQHGWRWKRVDENARHLESTESFTRRVDCVIDAVRSAVRQARNIA
jgi:hypothetical protein